MDRLTRGFAEVLDRRSGMRGLFALGAVAVGTATLASASDAEAGKTCKPSCNECQQCKKGKCHKTNGGKKRCKKGKCKAQEDGVACSTGTCQAGTCQPTVLPCGNSCTADETCVSEMCCVPETVGLQGAINRTSAGATITLCAGTWNLTDAVVISKNLRLRGAGAPETILDGGDTSRIIQIDQGHIVTVRNLTITNGKAPDHQPGGGISNEGALTLLGCNVTSSSADHGGGIANYGTLNLATGSSVSGNQASTLGGGISNLAGTVKLQDGSSVSNNTAPQGAGVENANGASLELEGGSSVSDNDAVEVGGGIHNGGGTLSLLEGATVSGNSAGLRGGGIYSVGGSVRLATGSSVTGNDAPVGEGGGVFNEPPLGDFLVEDINIVTGNTVENCAGAPVTPAENCVG